MITVISKHCGGCSNSFMAKDCCIKAILFSHTHLPQVQGLSPHRLNQPGCYRDVKDLTVVGQFKMKKSKA